MQLAKLPAVTIASMCMAILVDANGQASPANGCVNNQFCCVVVSSLCLAVNDVYRQLNCGMLLFFLLFFRLWC
jgi:hypothetical protein